MNPTVWYLVLWAVAGLMAWIARSTWRWADEAGDDEVASGIYRGESLFATAAAVLMALVLSAFALGLWH